MSGENLSSPLLNSPDAGYHAVSDAEVDITKLGQPAKFGEYVSRAKARASNTLTIFGCIPFNIGMLLCIMFLTFGSYWCYDIPGSIETNLTLWFGNSYTHASNLLFYSIYSWPNCILAFFGGVILDKVTGVRKGAMLFCGLVALGQLIFALGCSLKLYYLALFGRFVFGLGGENLTVAQNTYTVRWFEGKRLALAFGLVVAFSRIGTSVNFVVSPKLANSPISYTQTFYADTACQSAARAIIAGPVNDCGTDRREVHCQTAISEDVSPIFAVYNATLPTALSSSRRLLDAEDPYGTCGSNEYSSVPVYSDACISSPYPINNTYAYTIVHLDPDSTQYTIRFFSDSKCATPVVNGPGEIFGQGKGCAAQANMTVPTILGYSYLIDQPIAAPCYVGAYADSQCNTIVNKYAMKRDTCFALDTPNSRGDNSYEYGINPGEGVPKTVWFGMGMCAMSFLACCLASYSDWWGESKVDKDRQLFMTTLSVEEQAYVKKLDDAMEPTSDDISFKMIKKIPLTAWLLFIITAVFYIAILNFYQVASDLMQNTGNMISDDTAGLYLAIPNFVAIIGSPTGGFMVDKIGRALVLITIACGMLIGAHVFFLALAYGWISASPIPAMLWLGVTYSLGASSLWPILAFVVEKEALGTAYGCMTSVQNFFLAMAALIIGQLQDWAQKRSPQGVLQYTIAIWIFIGCAATALVLTIVLIGIDAKNGGKLNASAEERDARRKREEAEQEAKNQATANSPNDGETNAVDEDEPAKSLNNSS